MKVLIGYDGSESSDAIFEDLQRAGLPRVGEARIVSVADIFANAPHVSEFDLHSLASRRVEMALRRAEEHRAKVMEETKAAAAKAAERFGAEFPAWTVTTEVRVGSPQWELLDAANEWDADSVVVGSHGRSAIKRFLLGSVSKRLATDARSSVRVVRRKDVTPEGPPRIVIGVDGSPSAEEVVYAVGQRVWPAGTEVLLISVDDSTPPARIATRLPQAAAMINSYFQSRETRIASMLDWATEQLGAIGLNVSVVKKKGVAKDMLLDEARKWNADSIFVGTRDFKSAFERFRLGSVSTAVVTHADCSVEIVRPPAGEQV